MKYGIDGCSVHKLVKSDTEFEDECSLDKCLAEFCPVILTPDNRCLLVDAKGKMKISIVKSLIRDNFNRIVCTIVRYWSWSHKGLSFAGLIVGALIIAGSTYGSWISLVSFFAYTGFEFARYHEYLARRNIEVPLGFRINCCLHTC